MAYYPPPRAPQSPLAAFLRSWFNPARWTPADRLIAVAGIVLAVAVFLPWFKAEIVIRGANGEQGAADLLDPPGTVTGLAAHEYLLVALAVALLEVAVILARNFPGSALRRLPFHRYFLVVASGVDFVVVIAAAVLRPPAWYGELSMPPNFALSITWTYGAFAAAAAAVLSLGIAVAALRTDGF